MSTIQGAKIEATDYSKYQTIADVQTIASTATNPGAELDKDAFMKLLLTELQYQDPTDPMDSDKMLTQTSQLATLETQEQTNEVMSKLSSQMSNSMNMYAISAVGKMASLGTNAITLENGKNAKFEIYYKNEIKSGTLEIKNENGDVLKTLSLEEEVGKQGILAFEWDGNDNEGNRLPEDYYYVTSNYTDKNNEAQETMFGIYPVESVRMDGSDAYIKLGSSYVPLEYVKEYF